MTTYDQEVAMCAAVGIVAVPLIIASILESIFGGSK